MANAVWKYAGAAALAVLLTSSVFAQDSPAADSAEQQQVRQLEKTWADALVKKDQYGLDLVLAPGFVNISGTGEVSTKNQQISGLFASGYALETYQATITSIRIVGDTAIAQGTYSLQRKNGAADDVEKGVFTHVYQRSHGTWVCINAQRTIVTERAAPPIGKQKSKAEMPFHVPFTGKKKPAANAAQPQSSVTDFAPDNTPDSNPPPTPAPASQGSAAPASDTPQPQLESPKPQQ